jgi:GxxExxY protein
MNTDEHRLKHCDITEKIIGVFFEVYNELGFGFLESVYMEALALALSQAGLSVERELPLAVCFRGKIIGIFRADLVVGGAVLVETKAVSFEDCYSTIHVKPTATKHLDGGNTKLFPRPGTIRVDPCLSVAL